MISSKLERYGSVYNIDVYRRGVNKPIFSTKTPNSGMNYLTFNVDSFDNKYLVIDISGTDKHYYGEDREEYLGLTIILDVTGETVKILRQDTIWDIDNDRNRYLYKDGIMKSNV